MQITSLPSSTHFPGLTSNDGQPQAKTRPGSGLDHGLTSRASASRESALALFEKTLAMGYEKLGMRAEQVGAKYTLSEPLTAEKVADNILGFISRRLQMDVAEGATQEQLQSRLEAGLAGFKKGFAEASEQLKALSMLSPEIEQDIGKTYDLVIKGIDQLRQQFIRNENDSPSASKADTEGLANRAAARLLEGRYEYASANSFSFELMTAEGDRVTISAASSRAYAAQYSAGVVGGPQSGVGFTRMQASASSSDSLSWSVEGDLNEQELNAINKLLGQVNQLASEFFDGNLDSAFNQALSLGYDQEQITAFSLSLTQVEVQRVSATYQAFDGVSESGNLAERLLPLGQFIKHLLETVDDLRDFAEPENLLLDVAERMIAPDETSSDQPAKRFQSFIEQWLADRTQA